MRRVAIIAVAFAATPAFAQQAPLDKLYACAGVADSAARLSCFDAAVAGLKIATETGGAVVVNREQIARAEKEAFGLLNPSLTALAESAAASATPVASAAARPAEKPKTLESVTLAVKSIEKAPDGSYRFVMENGQVWRQTDDLRLPGVGKGPWTAEIRKAAMGTFMLKLGDRTAVRVKRLE
jgi:hypothetical protein